MQTQSRLQSLCSFEFATTGMFAAGVLFACTAAAQADGDNVVTIAPQPRPAVVAGPQQARIAATAAPGGALMNNLDARMRQIQATQDPALRQRRMDDFLKTLRSGMENIAKPGAATNR